jgi:competence protein ComEA
VLFFEPAFTLAQSTAKATSSARVDINPASKANVTALSGVDNTTAQKIIDGRPYTRKRQLLTKKIVPQSTYDSIKDEIVAKKPKK